MPREGRPSRLGDRGSEPLEHHRLRSGDVEALADRGRLLTAADQRVGHVVDVDRVQPYGPWTDWAELAAEDGAEEADKMQIAGAVDEPGPHDDRGQSGVGGGA